jgi:2-methylcitrate dehydratase PrpD
MSTTAQPTAALARFVAETTFERLPDEVVHEAKRIVLDTLGCALAGTRLAPEIAQPVLALADSLGGRPEATIWVAGTRTSAAVAAFTNATLVHTIDYDDTHARALTHTSSIIVPTAMALAERTGASGRAVIAALVAGYEATVRVGAAVMPTHYQYWHSTATNGTFGAAAVAGKLLGFDADRLDQALSIAADQAAGLISCIAFGDITQSAHSGFAALKGLLGAELIAHGAVGPRGLLEYERGYARAYSQAPKLEAITDGLGERYSILDNAVKFFPSILASHTPITAVLRLVRQHDLRPEQVARVEERTYRTAATTFCNPDPQTPLAARLSIPYCLAVAIIDRAVGFPQFTPERMADQAVRQLMARISVVADPELEPLYPEKFPAVLTIETTDGRVLRDEQYYPKGFPQDRLSDAELEEKFRTLAGQVLPPRQVDALAAAIWRLDALPDVRPLVKGLVVAHAASSR